MLGTSGGGLVNESVLGSYFIALPIHPANKLELDWYPHL